MNDSRITALERRVQRLNWYLLLLAVAVCSLGARQIVLTEAEENWKIQSATWERAAETRLQTAERWEAYWHQQEIEETAKSKGQ